jgi:hypothetical protein
MGILGELLNKDIRCGDARLDPPRCALVEGEKACKEFQVGSCCVTVSNITISYARLMLSSRS